ncbi:MAG: MoaD/ThiS family protein [Lysobacterales bacterium]
MAQIILAPAITRWLAEHSGPAPAGSEWRLARSGATLADVLAALFECYPGLRGYVLDERGVLRHHVVLFIDGRALPHSHDFGLALSEASEIYLAQALSGG